MYKILCGEARGGSAALALLDGDAYPFAPRAPPKRVRATLYHYDFTRVPSAWARRIPRVSMLPANCSVLGPWVGGGPDCARWWTRTRVREYVPPVDRGILEEQVIAPQGWPIGAERKPNSLPAKQRDATCKAGETRHALMPVAACEAVLAVRRIGAPLRRFVGFHVPSRPDGVFLDGPVLVILAALAVPLTARLLLRGAGALAGRHRAGARASLVGT
jgi:hypothetical protein